MAKVRVLVEETYQHIQEFEVPDSEVDCFDMQRAVSDAYAAKLAVPGKGVLRFVQVNDEKGSCEWKTLWIGSAKTPPVVPVPKHAPVRREFLRRVIVTAPSDYEDVDADLELRTRLLSADGEQHLETMNWVPDEEVTVDVVEEK